MTTSADTTNKVIGRLHEADALRDGAHVDTAGSEIPEHLDQWVGQGVKVHVKLAVCRENVSQSYASFARPSDEGKLTVDVILSVRLVALVVVDHLHNLQEILLAELRQRLGQLLHIHIAVRTLAHLLLLRLTGSRSASDAVGFGLVAHATALPQRIKQRALRIPECDIMRALIALLLEVEVVGEDLVARLGCADGREGDLHVELAPSLLVNGERRAAEGLAHALGTEGVVEDVGGFLEAVRRQLLAFGAEEEDANVPAAQREAAILFVCFLAVCLVSGARL